MSRGYYSGSIVDFLETKPDYILGQLLSNDEFETKGRQKTAWKKEIKILQEQLKELKNGEIVFEYTIPRIGHRVDTVCIIQGIIFLLEFKVGDKEYKKSTDDQVMDYALDLKYFHEMSKNRYIIPINISTEAPENNNSLIFSDDKISNPLWCNKYNIGKRIADVLALKSDPPLQLNDWMNSRYSPTPTIIESAQALYRDHSVLDISRNDAGAKNLTETTSIIGKIIDDCKLNKKKAICFVTGVPGAGKTLAGLNIATSRHKFDSDEHAVFLSGNDSLVDILQEALAKDKKKRDGTSLYDARRETKAFIQVIHKFRDEALTTSLPPIEKVAIFDEAQRAWDKKSLTDFMKNKKGVSDFNKSEPDFLISIMNRHKDWAVIVCLVGGGQEIYTGEAGIEEWFRTLRANYPDWDIYLSDKLSDSEYVGNTTINRILDGHKYAVEPSLHLAVSLRSFRSEKLAAFIKALLDNHPSEATLLYSELGKTYPIMLTRNYDAAKEWVRTKARGSERYGLLASSEGKRMRGIGIWVLPKINHVGWFLNDKDNVDSSYYLEVAASEFKVQGLEVDYALVAWDADLRRVNNDFDYYKFRGTSWKHVDKEQNQKYMKNAYRVLLTRARQGMIIYVPEGTDASVDRTRDHTIYDEIFSYLKLCGLEEI